MKRVCVILSIVLLCSVLCVPFCAFANSAQREFEGVSSTGVIVKDENCPVTVTSENLVFDISSFPVLFNGQATEYNSNVSAEYTFYNPADYDVNMQLVFPFSDAPYYMSYASDYSDTDKYSAYVDGRQVTTTVRATYSSGCFSLSDDLPKIQDARVPLTAFADDTPVYKYTASVTYTGKPETAERCYVQFGINNNQTLFTENMYSGVYGDSDEEQLRIYESAATIYSVGEPLSSDFFKSPTYYSEEYKRVFFNPFTNYKTVVKQIDGSVQCTESEQLTIGDLIFKYYQDDLRVSRDDYYNAVTYKLNRCDYKGNFSGISIFDVSSSLLLWYQYDVSVPSKQSVVNKVVAPLYPTIDGYSEPSKYHYEYYLSPATCWASFADLDITVNTKAFMSENTLSAFEKTEYGYHAHYDQLPQSELKFALCDSENPELDKGAWSVVMTVFLVFVCIILGLILLAVITGIVCAIVIPIVLTRKKNNNASSKAKPSDNHTERLTATVERTDDKPFEQVDGTDKTDD